MDPSDGPQELPVEAPGLDVLESRILTVPNLITVVRLACLPIFVWLLLHENNRAAASVLLGAIGATDWVDGYIARRFDQTSTVGKVLDPVADRLLFFTALVAILIDGCAPAWVCWAVLVREIVISIATLVLAALGARRIDVTRAGKTGTFLLMFAFPGFVAGASTFWWAPIASGLAWLFVIPGLVFSYWAAVLYVPIGRRALADGRHGRSTA
jgi:cardiolipin synthase (CMP-forming)